MTERHTPEQYWIPAAAVEAVRTGTATVIPEGLGMVSGFEIERATTLSARVTQFRAYGVVDGATHEAAGTLREPGLITRGVHRLLGREVRAFAYVECVPTPDSRYVDISST